MYYYAEPTAACASFLRSESPRRLELLRSLGLAGRRRAQRLCRGARLRHLSPAELASHHARKKLGRARAGSERAPASRCCGRHGRRSRRPALGKPARRGRGDADARSALGAGARRCTPPLRWRRPASAARQSAARRACGFTRLDPGEIAEYVASGEPFDKAGAYGIQGRAASLVEAIDGDFYTVMGLPLARVVRTLRRLGFTLPTHEIALATRAPTSGEQIIFTYRDERKLFALIGIIIVAALLALLQIGAQRSGETVARSRTPRSSIFAVARKRDRCDDSHGAHDRHDGASSLPRLESDNAQLRRRNRRLAKENARLAELAAAYAAPAAVRPGVAALRRHRGPRDRLSARERIARRDDRQGLERRRPSRRRSGRRRRRRRARRLRSRRFRARSLLVTDYTSRIPAVVRRGRWWGIARGNLTSVVVEYVEQDAPLRAGDVVVTGEGRSFHSGVPIGTIAAIERGNSTLYQTADLEAFRRSRRPRPRCRRLEVNRTSRRSSGRLGT